MEQLQFDFVLAAHKSYFIIYYKDNNDYYIHGEILNDRNSVIKHKINFGSVLTFKVKEVVVY